MNYQKVVNYLACRLREYLQGTSLKGFVVGVSGGVDSAVVSTLCAMTGLPTTVVSMPIHQDPDQVSRAMEHILWLMKKFPNVSKEEINLTQAFEIFKASIPPRNQTELLLANVRARLRMTALYSFGMLVTGTGNKIEDYGVFFYSKYGDGGVDISPIGDLKKTQVFKVAEYLDIIQSIRKAIPTDGLWGDNRSDEDQLGAKYPELEWAMDFCEKEGILTFDDISRVLIIDKIVPLDQVTARQREVLNIYMKWHLQGQHKMAMPPIFVIPEEFKV